MATILVVDDNEDNVFLLSMMLQSMGHDYLTASGGEEALVIMAREKIDLLLLDLMMPGMNGFEVATHLKADPHTAHVPIILLTAKKSDANDVAEGLNAGADEYLTKPIQEVELTGRVNSMLRMKALFDEVARSKKLMDEELAMATAVQLSLLPTRFPCPEKLSFSVRYEAAASVGGDFYDITDYGDGRVGVVIADVSGHGPSAAMVVAMVKAILSDSFWGTVASPAAVVRNLNDRLNEMIPEERYLTLFFGLLDVASGDMRYVRAGHPFPLLQRADGSVERLEAASDMVALFDTIEIVEDTITLHKGDRLLCYSDGIVEVFDNEGKQFGINRLIDQLKNGDGDDEKLLDDIMTASLAFQENRPLDDDAAILLMRMI